MQKVRKVIISDLKHLSKDFKLNIAMFWPFFQIFVFAFDSNAIYWNSKQTQNKYKQCFYVIKSRYTSEAPLDHNKKKY